MSYYVKCAFKIYTFTILKDKFFKIINVLQRRKGRQAEGRNDEPWPFLWSFRHIWLQCANSNGRSSPQIIPMFAACTVHTGRSWSIASTSKEKIVWNKSAQTTSITFLPMLVSCYILKSFNSLVLSKLLSKWLIVYVNPFLKCRQSVEVGRANDVSGEQMFHSDSGSRRVRFGAVEQRHV
jgi:hypothetical protein